MARALIQGGGSNVNVSKAFQESFGNLDHGAVYQDRFGVFGSPTDHTPSIQKAWENEYQAIDEFMQDGGTFRQAVKQVAVAKGLTTADLTLPVYPREDLVNLSMQRTPFWDALPKVAARTDHVDQDSVTGLATPQIGGETDVPASSQDDTFSSQQLAMAYWRIRGEVSGPMQLATSSLRNEMAGEQARKQMAMRHFGENMVLNGDPTTGTTDGSTTDERGFKGVRTLAVDNGRNRNPDAGTGTTITVEEVRESHRRAAEDGGDTASLLNVTDLKTLTDIKNDLDDHDPVEVTGPSGSVNLGARSVLVDGVPTVVSDFMPTTASSREFLTVDMRWHRVHNLSDMVMEALGKTQDSDEFFLKQYGVLEQSAGADKFTALLENLA